MSDGRLIVPRNRVAANNTLLRKGGVHQKTRKAQRRGAKMSLQQER